METQTNRFFLKRFLFIFSGILFSFLPVIDVLATNRNQVADFDGDGKTDISVFRPSDGYWYYLSSRDKSFNSIQFGLSGDKPVPGDYDGDGKTDFAVARQPTPNTLDTFIYWYILRSSDYTLLARQHGGEAVYHRYKPVPSDYDGDGRTDLAVFRMSHTISEAPVFQTLESSTNLITRTVTGRNGDRDAPADYDGDGRTDYAVYRNGLWVILQSSDNKIRTEQFGLFDDNLIPADYDGDGQADIAVWRPSNGYWYWISSLDKSFNSIQFGLSGDKPVQGDYDGDGKTDFAVFRPSNGVWYIQQSNKGFRAEQFGLSTDIPIPNVFVR